MAGEKDNEAPNPFDLFSDDTAALEQDIEATEAGFFGEGPVDFARDAGSSITRGLSQGVDETFDLASEAGRGTGNLIRNALPAGAERRVQQTLAPASNFFRQWNVIDDDGEFGLNFDDGLQAVGVEDGRSRSAQMIGGFSQWVGGFLAGGRAVRGLGAVTRTGKPASAVARAGLSRIGVKAGTQKAALARSVGQGIIGDFAGFDPNEDRLSNMVVNMGIEEPVTGFLAAEEDDNFLEGRVKQAIEGAVLGGFLEATLRGLGKTRTGGRVKSSVEKKVSEGSTRLAKGTRKALEIRKAEAQGNPVSPERAEEIAKEASVEFKEGAKQIQAAELEAADVAQIPFRKPRGEAPTGAAPVDETPASEAVRAEASVTPAGTFAGSEINEDELIEAVRAQLPESEVSDAQIVKAARKFKQQQQQQGSAGGGQGGGQGGGTGGGGGQGGGGGGTGDPGGIGGPSSGGPNGGPSGSASQAPFDIFVSPEQADEFMGRLRDNIVKTNDGVSLSEDYDPLSDLNLERIANEGSDKAREAVHAMARTLGEEMTAARGGVQTMEEVAERGTKFAEEMIVGKGQDGLDTLATNLTAVTKDGEKIPEVIDGLRQLAQVSRKRVLRKAEDYLASRSNENLASLFEEIQIMGNIQATVKGYSSQLGRGLGQLRRVIKASDDIEEVFQNIDDPTAISQLDPTGKSGNIDDAIDALARRVTATGGDPQAMARVLEPSLIDKVSRVATTYYQAAIMSNPGTLMVNAGGGVQQFLLDAVEVWWAGFRTGNKEQAREGLDQLSEMLPATVDAARFAFRAMKQNAGVLEETAGGGAFLQDTVRGGIDANSMGVNPQTAIGRFLDSTNKLTGLVFRPILFTDEFNKQIAFISAKRASLMRKGRERGLSGDDLKTFVDEESLKLQVDGAAVRGEDGRFAFQKGVSRAKAATFQAPLTSNAMRGIENFMRGVPFAKILVNPFLRTPVNILKEVSRRTPILRGTIDDVRQTLARAKRPGATQADIEEAARLNAKMEVGAMMYATFLSLAAGGVISGTGPSSSRQRWVSQQLDNWQPFSMKIGDRYFSFSRQDPIASHMMLAGAIHDMAAVEALRENPDDPENSTAADKAKEWAGVLFTSMMESMGDKTYLKGLSDWMEMLDSTQSNESLSRRFQKLTGQKIGGFVPSIIGSASEDIRRARGEELHSREVRTILEGLQNRVPGLEKNVDRRFDILGQPLEANHSFPSNMLNISRVSTESDPVSRNVLDLLLKADLNKRGIAKSINRIRIDNIQSAVTPDQTVFARWNELYGTIQTDPSQYSAFVPEGKTMNLKEALGALMESDHYRLRLTDPKGNGIQGTRLEEVGKLMSGYKSLAKKRLIASEPELREKINRRESLEEQAAREFSDPISEGELELRGRTSPTEAFVNTYKQQDQ